jgi:hypothetical protein
MIYTCLCNLKHLILLIILGFLVLIIKVIQMLTGCTCMWPQFLFYFKWIINDYMLFVVLMPCLDYSLPIITGVKLMTRNCKCNYGHPKMADVESDKNLFCRLNCILNGTCIGTIVIYEFITRKSQITTEKCIWKRKSDLKRLLNKDDRNWKTEMTVIAPPNYDQLRSS